MNRRSIDRELSLFVLTCLACGLTVAGCDLGKKDLGNEVVTGTETGDGATGNDGSGTGGDGSGAEGSGSGDDSVGPDCPDPDEPNDTIPNAMPLPINPNLEGLACAPADTDLWVFSIPDPGWVEPSVVFPEGDVLVHLTLGEPDTDGIRVIDEVEWHGGGQNDVYAPNLEPGDYIVSVHAEFHTPETLTYNITVTHNEG
jgi:hypothetical protein